MDFIFEQNPCQKSWDLVTGLMKQIPMQMFMMYMVGNGVQIFSILMTSMLLLNAVRGITAFNRSTYAPHFFPRFPQRFIHFVRSFIYCWH